MTVRRHTTFFCNKNYFKNVQKARKDLHLSTKGGGMVISREADVSGLNPDRYNDTVYYNVRAITNILSFKKLPRYIVSPTIVKSQ